jgi:quinol monooxygenase YgiN
MFIQVMEFRTDRRDELVDLARRWSEDATGTGTATRSRLCADRDDPGNWRWIVEFPSYEAAMKNSQRPETDAMSRKFTELCDGEPVFRNMDVAHAVG